MNGRTGDEERVGVGRCEEPNVYCEARNASPAGYARVLEMRPVIGGMVWNGLDIQNVAGMDGRESNAFCTWG